MGFKKIKIRNSALTLTGLVINLLIVIFAFTAGFLYLSQNMEDVGTTVDTKYNDTYLDLVNSTSALDDNIQDIQDNFDEIDEADNTFESAWNGMKGLGAVLLLPISFVATANAVFQNFLGLDILPGWISTLIAIGLITTVTLLILALLKGESKM